MSNLLNLDQALDRILARIDTLPPKNQHFTESLGLILAEDIYADLNLPPFANSSMDGYAVRAAELSGATREQPVQLRVVMDIPAGHAAERELGPGEAARIMTGAPLPKGADAVVPVEQTNAQWNKDAQTPLEDVVLVYTKAAVGDCVRPVGEDIQAGQRVLQAGTRIRPQEIGVLAALGRSHIQVIPQPQVVVLSSGDELVDVDQPLKPGAIRDTNSYTLAALVRMCGAQALRLPPAPDRLDAIRSLFQEALTHKPDVIISSAGVSVGAADLVRTVLDELGEVHLWRINVRPGKPLAFGHLQGIPFFGLPGNPVSAMVTFDAVVRPAVAKLAGQVLSTPFVSARTEERLTSADGRRSYIRVKLTKENGYYSARTTGTQSSGALMSMVLADGLLIIPEGVTEVPAGTELQVRLLKELSEIHVSTESDVY